MAQILVMEDEEDFGHLLKTSLENAGHDVTLCIDATSAEAAFKGGHFDLVIADVIVRKDGRSIPDGGLTLITKIRRILKHSNPDLPIIAMSGVTHFPGMQAVLSIATSLGATVSLRKPFAPDTMINLIAELLTSTETKQDKQA